MICARQESGRNMKACTLFGTKYSCIFITVSYCALVGVPLPQELAPTLNGW